MLESFRYRLLGTIAYLGNGISSHPEKQISKRILNYPLHYDCDQQVEVLRGDSNLEQTP